MAKGGEEGRACHRWRVVDGRQRWRVGWSRRLPTWRWHRRSYFKLFASLVSDDKCSDDQQPQAHYHEYRTTYLCLVPLPHPRKARLPLTHVRPVSVGIVRVG